MTTEISNEKLLELLTLTVKTVFGVTCYYNSDGALHRLHVPAIVSTDGGQQWFVNGECHRDGAPAMIFPNGTEYWYQHWELHRIGGPAVTYVDGSQEWWENGERIK